MKKYKVFTIVNGFASLVYHDGNGGYKVQNANYADEEDKVVETDLETAEFIAKKQGEDGRKFYIEEV